VNRLSEKDAARPDQVTFVIATYNRLSVLEARVSQILALVEQAEVIIIDDGSGDGTAAFLTLRLGNYSRLRLLTNERNRGSAYCWNLGIQNTRTPYLVFLPDDALELLPTVDMFARTVCLSLRHYDIVGLQVVEPNVFPKKLRGTLRDIVTTRTTDPSARIQLLRIATSVEQLTDRLDHLPPCVALRRRACSLSKRENRKRWGSKKRHITQLGKNLKQVERIGRNRTTTWQAR